MGLGSNENKRAKVFTVVSIDDEDMADDSAGFVAPVKALITKKVVEVRDKLVE